MAAAGSGTSVQTESTDAENLKATSTALQLEVLKAFYVQNAILAAIAAAIGQSLQGKINSINTLGAIQKELDQWNSPPGVPKMPADPSDPVYKDRVDKTDALLLDGVSIPDDTYDSVKYSYNEPGKATPTVGYASLPVEAFSDGKKNGLVDGQLYWMATSGSPNEKTYYRYSAKSDSIDPISSSIPAKTKAHDDDFSKFQPGDLVQDDQTKKYYRVTNDQDGVEVTDYPLQKFIYTASDDAISKLQTAISNRLTTLDNLSKKDTLAVQESSGNRTTLAQEYSNILSAFATLANAILRNIS